MSPVTVVEFSIWVTYLFPSLYFQFIVFLNLKCVACRQSIRKIHSAMLFFSTVVFNLFTFNVITDKVRFTSAT